MFDSFVTNRSNLLVPFAHLTDVDSDEHSSENIPPTERLRCALENLFSSIETFRSTNIPIDLKLLLVFMCGGEKNHVETFLTHLSQRFSLIGNGQSSFIINIPIGRTQRKVNRTKFLTKNVLFSLSFRSNSFVFLFIRFSLGNSTNSMVFVFFMIETEKQQ